MSVDRPNAAIAMIVATLLAIAAFGRPTLAPASNTTGAIEYKVVRLSPEFAGNSEATLNQWGAQGWDIAYGVGEYLVMKRSK
jgi:hypothetical protein